MEKLQQYFLRYCAAGSNSNANKMPLYKFVTFLKDCGIISTKKSQVPSNIEKRNKSAGFPAIEAELIFTKILKQTGASGKHNPEMLDKLDFKSFYAAMIRIGQRFYPSLNQNEALIALTVHVFHIINDLRILS